MKASSASAKTPLYEDSTLADIFDYLPDSLKGRILAGGALYGPGTGVNRSLARRFMRSPGAVSSLREYLNGEGSGTFRKIVAKRLGKKWYAPLAANASRIGLIRGMMLDRELEKYIPSIGGDKELAKTFMAAGGNV